MSLSKHSYESRLLEKARRRRRFLILAGTLVLSPVLIFCLLWFVPASRAQIDTFRAKWKARQVSEALDKERWRDAYDLAHEAYQLSNEDPEVLRVAADMYERAGQRDGILLREKLVEMDQANHYDMIRLATGYIGVREYSNAKDILEVLLEKNSNDLDVTKMLAISYDKLGNFDKAWQLIDRAIELNPNDEELFYLRARYRFSSESKGELGDLNTAKNQLLSLATGEGEFALTALSELLAKPERLEQRDIQKLLGYLSEKEEAMKFVEDELGVFVFNTLKIKTIPQNKKLIIEDLQRRFLSADNKWEDAEMIRWLHSHSAYLEILNCIDVDNINHDAVLVAMFLNAAIKREQWNVLNSVLEDPELKVAGHIRNFFYAYSVQATSGDRESVKTHLGNALLAAPKNIHHLFAMELASFAKSFGYEKLESEYYRIGAEKEDTRNQALRGLVDLADRNSDVGEMIERRFKLNKLYPEDSKPLLEGVLLQVIAGYNLEEAMVQEGRLRGLSDLSEAELQLRNLIQLALKGRWQGKGVSQVDLSFLSYNPSLSAVVRQGMKKGT